MTDKTERKLRHVETKPSPRQLKVLLNMASGFPLELGVKGPLGKTLDTLKDRGWIDDSGALTQAGKEAAGLVLKEVPLPKHLADLVKPKLVQTGFIKRGARGPRL